jgi:hypothetical protein
VATIILTVGPLGKDFSWRRGGAYYGRYPTRSEATRAADEEAKRLRGQGHTVVIKQTGEKPGKR